MNVRTRIAPSPTGDPHVGTAYVALFNKMFAHSQGGKFILRIEDTDQQRSSAVFEKAILSSLHWLGLNWDEGPDLGGQYGPYRQSERLNIYAEHAQILLQKGYAFRCFCSRDRLNDLRQQQIKHNQFLGYDGCCLQLTDQVITQKLANQEAYVIRMKVPKEGVCNIYDQLRGNIEIAWEQVDMQILIKDDGMPTYHLANVVDDHLMKITHVIRGEEWINSAPKHQLLYEYFNWKMPQLYHLPLLRNLDKSKLSKRKNATGIEFYRDMGYLPEAVVNYLGRMGWSMPNEQEKFTLAEMQEHFNIKRVSLGGPIFDSEKLSWLNGVWIRENLTDEQFNIKLNEWFNNRQLLQKLVPMVKSRIEKLSDFIPMVQFMFAGMLDLSANDFADDTEQQEIKKKLQFVLWSLDTVSWNRDAIFNSLTELANSMQIKMNDLMRPIFIAIAGSTQSWSVVDSMYILGTEITRARLRHAINLMGGISGKILKKLQKEYVLLCR